MKHKIHKIHTAVKLPKTKSPSYTRRPQRYQAPKAIKTVRLH